MQFKAKFLSVSFGIFGLIFITACDEQGQQDSSETDDIVIIDEVEYNEVDSKRALLVESIIRSSPTLAQTSEIFGSMGNDFDRSNLNELENVSKYNTLNAKGINLGVYLADLGYITSFEQTQEIIFYMNCAQKMAEGIGVSDVFDEATVERMEMNINDKDSVLVMISNLYWKTDAFLKELGRQNISALIICGAWVEAMHIGSMVLNESGDNQVIINEIYAQKNNLNKIMRLLNTFEDDEGIDFFKERLAPINAEYELISQSQNGQFTVEQQDILLDISTQIDKLRSEITTP